MEQFTLPSALPAPETSALTIQVLGGLQIRREGQLLPHALPTLKAASLFAFLLLHPNRELSRDCLADRFWPDGDQLAAYRSLSVALVPIRRLLEPRQEDRGRFLVSTPNMLRLVPPSDCWVDVWAFEQASSEAKNAVTGSPEWFDALERAVTLYKGDLLEGQGEEWCLTLREELQQRLLSDLHDLTQADRERQQYARACEWARRALRVDFGDDTSHRQLMWLFAAQGEQAKAQKQYHDYRRYLREELGVPPDPETHDLYQRLKERRQPDQRPQSPVEQMLRYPELTFPLLGRERELGWLQGAWERARAGRGELVLLTGEAGIGKSCLGRRVLQSVALEGGLSLYGRASDPEDSFLYRSLVDPLRRALQLAAEQRLTLCAPVWLAQVAQLVPEVAHLSGSLTETSMKSPRLLEEGMAQLLLALSAQRPLCLFLDDLHCADAGTGRFLHYLAHQSRHARILLIGSYLGGGVTRSEWLEAWVTEVEARRLATTLPLARLNAEEVARLLEQLAEGRASEALLQLLGEQLYEETEGNPLFLLETLRCLFEQEYLTVNEEGCWWIASEAPAPLGTRPPMDGEPLAGRLPLPSAVRWVVRHLVERLREEDRHLLQCAAVIGRRFTFETLLRATGQELEPTMATLERLLAADLIRAQAHPSAFDFSHGKIRDVLYDELLPARRQELHRRVQEALQSVSTLRRSHPMAPFRGTSHLTERTRDLVPPQPVAG
jgi:DNA-binding SARP family transcriptional activator